MRPTLPQGRRHAGLCVISIVIVARANHGGDTAVVTPSHRWDALPCAATLSRDAGWDVMIVRYTRSRAFSAFSYKP